MMRMTKVTVAHAEKQWTITGHRNTVSLDETTLAVMVQAESKSCHFVPSSSEDVLVDLEAMSFESG
jgi:hypothetical protein